MKRISQLITRSDKSQPNFGVKEKLASLVQKKSFLNRLNKVPLHIFLFIRPVQKVIAIAIRWVGFLPRVWLYFSVMSNFISSLSFLLVFVLLFPPLSSRCPKYNGLFWCISSFLGDKLLTDMSQDAYHRVCYENRLIKHFSNFYRFIWSKYISQFLFQICNSLGFFKKCSESKSPTWRFLLPEKFLFLCKRNSSDTYYILY